MSIATLLKQNGMDSLNMQNKDNNESLSMHNPDIRGDNSAITEKKSNVYDKIKGSAKFKIYNNYRFDNLRNKPLNGDFLRMKSDDNYGNMSCNQQLEASMDPMNRMRKINPLRAAPFDYINGAEGMNFRDLPKSVYESHNSVNLVETARNSYASRLVSFGLLPSFQVNNMLSENVQPPAYVKNLDYETKPEYQTNVNPSYISVEKLI